MFTILLPVFLQSMCSINLIIFWRKHVDGKPLNFPRKIDYSVGLGYRGGKRQINSWAESTILSDHIGLLVG